MTYPHPLALRILAALGASTAAAVAMIPGGAGCCPPLEDTGPYEATLGPNCTVTLESSLTLLVERCINVVAEPCPAFDDPAVQDGTLVCGPLREAVAVQTPALPGGGGASAQAGNGAGGISPEAGGGNGGTGGVASATSFSCCYGATQSTGTGAICGRPFLVNGVAVVSERVERGDWVGQPIASVDLPDQVRAEISRRWSRDALLEHASIAAFARFVLDLLAIGAPPDLVRAAQRAIADEIDHAERCFALASRYAGSSLGPGVLAVVGAEAVSTREAIALRVLEEGCVGETIAALHAQRALELATDPEARRALEIIARDEAAHAELAYRFIVWAARDADTRAALAREIDRLLWCSPRPSVSSDLEDPQLARHGQPGGAFRARVAEEALHMIIAPCLAVCLAEGPSA